MNPNPTRWSPLEASVIAAIILTIAASALAGASEVDEFTRKDRLEHASAGAVIGIASYLVIDTLPETCLRPRWQKAAMALVPVVLAGVVKEISDMRDPEHHDADCRDCAATILGGILSITVVVHL